MESHQGKTGDNRSMQSPLSDLMFDWVSILHSKAEGLEAYEKYLRDAEEQNSRECIDLLTRLREQDMQAVRKVKDHVVMLMSRQSPEMAQGANVQGDVSQQSITRH